jgi:transposase
METPSSIRAELNAISATDWSATPVSVQRLLLSLIERVEEQSRQIAILQAENAELRAGMALLRAENAELREQVSRNSGNSSQPPSTDKGFKVSRKGKSGGRRGGQVGHPGHERLMFELDDCAEVIEHYPEQCAVCGKALRGEDPSPYRHQVVELPPLLPEVVEHRFHALVCPACEALTRAASATIVSQGGYGPRLRGIVVLLSAQAHQSHAQVVRLLDELFGVSLSTGMVAKLRRQFTTAVQPVMASALTYVRQQSSLGMDETGWRQGNCDGQNTANTKGWLWVMTTAWVSYFQVRLSRSQAVTQELLGADYTGRVGSDRAGAYNILPLDQRQICLAHLNRDFTAMAERSGVSREIGQALLDITDDIFDLWYDFRTGIISRAGLRAQIWPLRQDLKQVLREAVGFGTKAKTPLDKTARTCAQILKVEPAIWTFVEHPGVEPTNNAAERAIRPAVLWRKVCLGAQSQAGAEFVAAALTVIMSLQSQDRNVLDYLTDVFDAHTRQLPMPLLLPST